MDTVTCCFTVEQLWTEIWVDEEDITLNVVPSALTLSNTTVSGYLTTYSVSFREPDHRASIAIKGHTFNEALYTPSMMLRCNTTNPNSAWNIISHRGTGINSWKIVTYAHPEWYNNTYSGIGITTPAPPGTVSPNGYTISDNCGPVSEYIVYTLQIPTIIFRRMIDPV